MCSTNFKNIDSLKLCLLINYLIENLAQFNITFSSLSLSLLPNWEVLLQRECLAYVKPHAHGGRALQQLALNVHIKQIQQQQWKYV